MLPVGSDHVGLPVGSYHDLLVDFARGGNATAATAGCSAAGGCGTGSACGARFDARALVRLRERDREGKGRYER